MQETRRRPIRNSWSRIAATKAGRCALAVVLAATLCPGLRALAEPSGQPANLPLTVSQQNVAGQIQTLLYEDDELIATVKAPNGTFPEGSQLVVEKIKPVDYESAEVYCDALDALGKELRAQEKSCSGASVYDIRILDPDGAEIEPGATVAVELAYKDPQVVSDEKAAVEVAHLVDAGEIEIMDADVNKNAAGAVKSTEFATDSFSYYIVFNSNQGSTSEPINFGTYGWLKFATPTERPYPEDPNGQWGHYSAEQALPTIYPGTTKPDGVSEADWEEQYHRIMQVRLHVLNQNGDETSYDDVNYTNVANNEYFWTWENSIYINDFYVPGYEVVHTKMHTAWDTGDPLGQDSLVGPYSVRGYRSSDGTANNPLRVDHDLNVLDVYMKHVDTPRNAMRYIIRYVHADGSVTDGNVRYLESGKKCERKLLIA